MKKLLKGIKSKNIDGLILDVRGNPGGALQEATQIIDLFVDNGPSIIVKIKKALGFYSINKPENTIYTGPLVVLTNTYSASASELFAASIKGHKRGLIVGSKTYGKGTIQSVQSVSNFLKLPSDKNEAAFKVTTGIFYGPSGHIIQKKGVLPDIKFPNHYFSFKVGEEYRDHTLDPPVIQTDFSVINPILEKALPKISERSLKRTKLNNDFLMAQELYELVSKESENTLFSLNENKNRKFEKQKETDFLNVYNKYQKLKGHKVVGTLKAAQDDLYSSSNDYELEETQRVLVDLIELTGQ